MERRGFLTGGLAAISALMGWALGRTEAGATPPAPTVGEWEFVPYELPKVVGWRGYWTVNRGRGREIMAFEDLRGQKIASPWAIQVPDYFKHSLPRVTK